MGSSPTVGDEVVLDVGPIAHGGHCVARHEGRVLFVRHALPGERVRVRVTEGGDGDRFLRADCIDVLTASADRVRPPCPFAGPGRCGGCDFQHVSLSAQRALKAAVVREQFARLAHLDVAVRVEPVPGDRGGLGWRTRMAYAVDAAGVPGLRAHRSHDIVPVGECLLATPAIRDTDVLHRNWVGLRAVDIVDPSQGAVTVVPVGAGPDPAPVVVERVTAEWPDWSSRREFAADFDVGARGFWQVHPGAASTFVGMVLTMLSPVPGERALDLYAGVGLFAAALADAVGPSGQVVAVESDAEASEHARRNCAAYGNVVTVPARVDDAFGVARPKRRGSERAQRARRLRRSPLLPDRADLVVLDPPRTGAGRGVVDAVAALQPRAVAYVACDPAALARDTATFLTHGYRLEELRAFDAFPMTAHLECVAHLVRA